MRADDLLRRARIRPPLLPPRCWRWWLLRLKAWRGSAIRRFCCWALPAPSDAQSWSPSTWPTSETETGLLVTIRRSKTDQEGEGVTIAIARGDVACPARALQERLDAAGIETGPIFRPINKAGTVAAERLRDRSIANIVKTYAERAGFDATTFSGHSLRSGFLTSAAAKGASIFMMMDVSRHESVDTLRGYVRDAELFKDNAGAGLLLAPQACASPAWASICRALAALDLLPLNHAGAPLPHEESR
jgi:hypothetical protein